MNDIQQGTIQALFVLSCVPYAVILSPAFACARRRRGGSPPAGGRVLQTLAAHPGIISAHREILRTAHAYRAGSE